MTNQDYINAIELGQCPRYIFKYRPANSQTIDAIKNNYLWFSNFESFNDPYEGKIRLSNNYTQNELLAFIMSRSTWPKNKLLEIQSNPKELIQQIVEGVRMNAKLCCFSECNDNILLWSHYANQHQGICLQFDYSKNQTSLFRMFRAVNYCSSFSSCNYIRNSLDVIDKLVFTKAIDWHYEKEYRAAFSQLEGNKVPYSPNALTRIIFGCKTTEEYKQQIMSMAPKFVTFAQCRLNINQYKLEIEDINN